MIPADFFKMLRLRTKIHVKSEEFSSAGAARKKITFHAPKYKDATMFFVRFGRLNEVGRLLGRKNPWKYPMEEYDELIKSLKAKKATDEEDPLYLINETTYRMLKQSYTRYSILYLFNQLKIFYPNTKLVLVLNESKTDLKEIIFYVRTGSEREESGSGLVCLAIVKYKNGVFTFVN